MRKSLIVYILILFISCEDKVKEFDGFTQKELEFLLSSDEGKAWQRIAKQEDGNDVVLDGCDLDNFLFYVPGTVGAEKPLLYAYNPNLCDSLEFCELRPELCRADTMMCNADPEFCDLLSDEVLYIGTWYAKEPFIINSRSDTLVFTINNSPESIHVTSITSQNATLKYKSRTGENGGIITEYYHYSSE